MNDARQNKSFRETFQQLLYINNLLFFFKLIEKNVKSLQIEIKKRSEIVMACYKAEIDGSRQRINGAIANQVLQHLQLLLISSSSSDFDCVQKN